MIKYLTLICLIFIDSILISGCQQSLIKSDGIYRPIGIGAYIVLKREISIPPENSRIAFQEGKLITVSQLNLYQVNCELEVNKVLTDSQTISPDTFVIMSVSQDESPIVQAKPLQFASLEVVGRGSYGYGSLVDTKRFWRFKLKSEEQPDVRAFICRGAQERPFNAELPTLEEMTQAVGDYIQLHID